jgi:putative nucleotidyltransferase with HDIG domain
MSNLALPAPLESALQDRMASNTLELPVLPEVAGQVLVATMSSDADARSLTRLLRRDQSLSGHVLRISNSPLYKPRVPIFTLEHAVARLGMKALREIAGIVTCQTRVFSVPNFAMEVRDLYRHSLATAIYAQEVARVLRWQDEAAFLCGLLHDVGRPVLLQTLTDLMQELQCPADDEAIFAACDRHHAEVGRQLIEAWTLPAMFSEPVLYHHRPMEAPERTRYGAMMTHLADDLAHHALGPRRVSNHEILGHPMLIHLGLHTVDMDRLLIKQEEICETVESMD